MATKREVKIPRGVGLRPATWALLDALAERRGVSRNQVIEEVIESYFHVAPNPSIFHVNLRKDEDSAA